MAEVKGSFKISLSYILWTVNYAAAAEFMRLLAMDCRERHLIVWDGHALSGCIKRTSRL